MNIVDTVKDRRQLQPLVSLSIIIAVALLMSIISFTIFWNSPSKDIVQSIQRTNQNFTGTPVVASGLDEDNVLSAAELLFIQESLAIEASVLTPGADFGGQELDKAIIGY